MNIKKIRRVFEFVVGAGIGLFFLGTLSFFVWGIVTAWQHGYWGPVVIAIAGFLIVGAASGSLAIDVWEDWQEAREKKRRVQEDLQKPLSVQIAQDVEDAALDAEINRVLDEIVEEGRQRNLKLYGTEGFPEGLLK